jgi:hypothetical protein
MNPITIASLLASAVGTGVGSFSSAKQSRKYDKYLDNMRHKNQNWYDKEYNTNYLDTDEAKSYIRTMLDQVKEATGRQESKGAITGATAEKSVAMKDAMNKNFNTGVTHLAGYGTRRKDRIQEMFMNREGQFDNMKLMKFLKNQQNWDQFTANSMEMGQNAMLSGMDKFDLSSFLPNIAGGGMGQSQMSKNATTIGMENTFAPKHSYPNYWD